MNDLAKIRTDVVGSLLRPANLKDARVRFDDGEISEEELRAIEEEAVQAAVAACLGEGVKGSAAVVDSAGVLRVLVSADGSSKNSAELSPKKAIVAVQLKKPTSEIQAEMEKDPALKAKLEADKSLFPRAGALPILAGNDVIGAIGFGGANGAQGGGTHDEACAKAGLDKIKARVK